MSNLIKNVGLNGSHDEHYQFDCLTVGKNDGHLIGSSIFFFDRVEYFGSKFCEFKHCAANSRFFGVAPL